MTDIKTGGPAFPRPMAETSLGGNYEQDGMDLRDYFAASIRDLDDLSVEYAEALCGRELPHKRSVVGLSTRKETIEIMRFWAEADALYRYIKADAMIAAREGGAK